MVTSEDMSGHLPETLDDELIREFTDALVLPDKIVLRVCWISWSSPSTAKLRWHTVANLPKDTDVNEERRKLLGNKKYFAVCKECHERKPIGWMHSKEICQGCSGVVY